MIVAITGASGMVGTALRRSLTARGDEPRPLRRTPTEDGIGGFEALPACDALVHLAGESIASRWSTAKRQRIRDSRIALTGRLLERVRAMTAPPRVLVSASAIGIYGDRRDEELTEDSALGSGFLAEVCREWEAAAAAATDLGIRAVHLRIGIVLSATGGALRHMLMPFRLGLGGRLGSGEQWMSWIHLEDVVRMIESSLDDESWCGAVNAVAPTPVTNAEFTRALGRVLRRPTLFPAPRAALRLLFGQMVDELLLASTRVLPKNSRSLGFEFDHANLDGALTSLIAGTRTAPGS